ncbi:protocadherin Fat 3-like isoform X2 [Amphibalanus amphitrite]|uniref:protocadherin Fat 3-like isoform X2 n=1 Tax=Amphibalanus amphitrite TaxID=1232801 RepID=UPI001C919D2A|nr:protocadherin Fat 3-like isoform X2 [Amphibalanus amphitrite]
MGVMERGTSCSGRMCAMGLMGRDRKRRTLSRCWTQKAQLCPNVRWLGLLGFVVTMLPGAFSQDSRCYLPESSSVATFFVPEDLPVGAVIGSLQVQGDPSERGDIRLSLDRQDYPVTIQPGTSNITLTSALDREGRDGPSSVAVSVICERKGTTDPSIVIPVNIRVQDVNDNAPRFIGDPYTLNISEVTVPGTVVLQGIKAVDADQQGPFSTVHYSVIEGNYAEYIDFANGLDGTLRLKQQLDFETVQQFRLTLRAEDQGDPVRSTEAILTVNVIDADDQNPRFFDDRYVTTLPTEPRQGDVLTLRPRRLRAFDQDIGINAPVTYAFTSDGADSHYFAIDRESGEISIAETIPDSELLQPITLVVKATQVDNADRYALTTLTVRREGVFTEDLQFVQANYVASVLENRRVGSVILTVITNRLSDPSVRYYMPEQPSQFKIQRNGEVVLVEPLDYETQDRLNFSVVATNGRQTDTANISIIVLNVNDWDPRFRYPSFDFAASPSARPGDVVGRLTVYDGDRGDRVSLGLMGQDARGFSVTKEGDLVIRDVSVLNSSVAHLVAVARDSGVPPRRSSVPVTVRFPQELLGPSTRAESSLLLMIIFGVLLGVLILVIVTLALYICKYKKDRARNRRTSPALGTKVASYVNNSIPHEKLDGGGSGSGPDSPRSSHIGSNLVVDLDTVNLDRSLGGTATLSRSSRRFSRGASANGSLRNPLATGADLGTATLARQAAAVRGSQRSLQSNASSTFRPGGSVSGWPDGSIPKRVKKLSWEDEQNRTELDPDVSVTPLPNTPSVEMEQSPVAVYF